MNNQPHLLVIDGMALLFRSFYATSVMGHFQYLPDGRPSNGVQGFARHVLTAQSIIKPSHIAICWDMGANTFRNELFEGYKTNRSEPPEEMIPQFDMAKEVSEWIGWKNIGEAGMEADDCIGSIVEKWKEEAQITIISGDKDLLQLLNPSTNIAFTKKGYSEYDVYTMERFKEEYAIEPHQFVDVKAFMGDSSDGYPGVKGIGPKTALQLIQKYGSVEGVLQNLDELKPGQRNKIADNLEMLKLSYRLASIEKNIPIKERLEDLSVPEYSANTFNQLANKGFTSIAKHAYSLYTCI
ncbi:5'-3' exonuclease [Ureibacillus thermosphaericus]|uniref:5'-3' exonuclease n=1 Tax=Ureibacillus thermosphaericus TaxID=51173 RepID=A0A840PPV6_URETH|nr:5'-3' exonuclease [Ureibacillus thermosphaericus]MBB5148519.1 5'-3' exonuclease [Ureibacillus thermosphaericus]NKZ31011.1 5'-3' exonuclease [Ureibacillus thermosphaericus]